ncbi:MAG: polymorphic toxin type 15 domain-containing protein [Micrococcales bacterium]|nr:polymorphic toxin type 15 domain-containing protein [Micrococcales bacterium]
MSQTGVVVDPADVAPAREWWQRWAERKARWWERHPTLRRRVAVVRTVGLWIAVLYVLVVALVWPQLLLGLRAWAAVCLAVVAWFFLARTKTLTWSGFMRFFAVCGLWSVVIALVLAVVSSAQGNAGVDALGPTTFVAGLGEESLKLVPLVVLVVAAPRRVSRFAAVDWWLLGLAAGFAFELVEEGARRVFLLAEMDRQGLLAEYYELYGAGVPEGWTTFGLLPSASGGAEAEFAGHVVATGMVAALAGLAVVVWRWGRGHRFVGFVWRVAAVAAVVVCLVTMTADHVVSNAYNDDSVTDAWLDGSVSAVPWWLRVPWQVFGHGHYRAVWFVVLFVVCLLVDGYRLGARPASSLAGTPLPPGLGAMVTSVWVACGRPARALAVLVTAFTVTGYVVVRDVGQVAAAHARGVGEPVRAAMRRGAVATSTARALREEAMGHAAGKVHPARSRMLGLVLAAALVVVALVVAPYLAVGTGPGMLGVDTGWLAGVLTAASEYWNSLPLARQIAAELLLGAMFALMMGPIGWGVAGVLCWGLRHGAGVVTFARDPRVATRDYLANLTPAQLVADGVDAVLTFAPVNFAGGGHALAWGMAHHAVADPVGAVATRRALVNHGLPAAHPHAPGAAAPSARPAPSAAAPPHPGSASHAPGSPHPAAGPAHPQAGSPQPGTAPHAQATPGHPSGQNGPTSREHSGGEPAGGRSAGASSPRQRMGDTVPSDGSGGSHATIRGYEITPPTPAQVRRLDELAATPGSGVTKHPDGSYSLTETVEVRFDVDGYFAGHPKIDPNATYSSGVTYRQEYIRQLELQESGMNDLTVAEWRHNVDHYSPATAAETRAHEAARIEAGGTRGDGTALVHGPDRVAGGRPNTWDGLGHRGINSSIGSRWKNEVEGLKNTVGETVKQISKGDPELLKFIRMNVRLVPG